MPTTSVALILSLVPRRHAAVIPAVSMIVLIGAAACTQVSSNDSAQTNCASKTGQSSGDADSGTNNQNPDGSTGFGIHDILDDSGPEKDRGPAACLTPNAELVFQTRVIAPVEGDAPTAAPRSACSFVADQTQDEFDIGRWLGGTTPLDHAMWSIAPNPDSTAKESPAPWATQLIETIAAVGTNEPAAIEVAKIPEDHTPAWNIRDEAMPEDHSPAWAFHDEPMPEETAAAIAPAQPNIPTKPHAAVTPPQVFASTFPQANRRSGAIAATVTLALQIATLACICITFVFAYFASRSFDAAGRPIRAFTIATGFVLCVGGAVSLLVGACWMGSQSLGSVAGDAALAGQIRLVIVAMTGIGLGVVAAMGYTRSVHAPLNQMIAALRAAATGDFQQPPINAVTRNELGELARAADKIVANMKDAITEVSISSLDLAAAAGEIVAGTKEASSSVGEVAERCGQTVASANEAGRYADQSNQAVSQTAAAFHIIDQSVQAGARSVRSVDEHGRNIAQIVRVIDDIADRTHLVALNASIEAAKSGTQGRGLGQIAEEVRRLAERAQVATEEVAKAVEAIQRESQTATNQIETGAAQIKHTAEINARAGSDLALMAKAASGVAGAVQSISDVAEDAGAGAAQAATAADQLSAKAEDLKTVVGRFRLDTGRFLKYASGTRVAGVSLRP